MNAFPVPQFSSLPSKPLILALCVGFGLCALALAGDSWASVLQFERRGIEAGDYYRLISGHFVHLGWVHALLNALALAAIGWVFAESFTIRTWLITVFCCCAFISWGLLTLTDITWYRGFSGVLHGLYVVGAMTSGSILFWRLPLMAGLGCKLVFDLYWGDQGSTAALIGGNVIEAAHWLGALAGAVIALGLLVLKPKVNSRARTRLRPAPDNDQSHRSV